MQAIDQDRIIRRCRFTPYLPGKGPRFSLVLYDLGAATYNFGRSKVGYRLTMTEPGKRAAVLFQGEDFSPGASMSIDGDHAVASLMSFLTCAPGDTDDEYFDKHTPAQLDFCTKYAESLSCEVSARFPGCD